MECLGTQTRNPNLKPEPAPNTDSGENPSPKPKSADTRNPTDYPKPEKKFTNHALLLHRVRLCTNGLRGEPLLGALLAL